MRSLWGATKRFLIGRPLQNEEIVREKIPKWKAMAIFSSDPLSSVGYGPEEILVVLTGAAGVFLYGFMAPVALSILVLLAIVTVSYVQVARANPGGGGAYSVAKNNLGEWAALTAASALFVDYSLTVAVSVSSGTDAISSAIPVLAHHKVLIDLMAVFGLLMVINLRGVRESATAFVFPTYAFIIGVFILVAVGVYHAATGTVLAISTSSLNAQFNATTAFIILRAFASGCSSMTGVEAISNGVPMFRKPEAHNAVATTIWMSSILAVMFSGVCFLIMHYHIMPSASQTALSQVAEHTFGRGVIYYYIQIVTMLVLFLAANTSYNGLPPLLSILARDGYMPRYLAARGDRLGFTNGIVLLSVVASTLIVAYRGNTVHLISLYAIGVFTSFTIAQTGLVLHWRREGGRGWQGRAALNGLGALATGTVVIVVFITKFLLGGWLVALIIPCLIYVFRRIKRHYCNMSEQLAFGPENRPLPGPAVRKNIVIIPVAGVNRVVAGTIEYAKTLSSDLIALHVSGDKERMEKTVRRWEEWNPGVKLVTFYSPYRTIMQPIISYIEQLEREKGPDDYITVLIPEFEVHKWWHRFLHNQTGWLLRTILILHKNVVVTVVPYRLWK